jgi:hypothetical protein
VFSGVEMVWDAWVGSGCIKLLEGRIEDTVDRAQMRCSVRIDCVRAGVCTLVVVLLWEGAERKFRMTRLWRLASLLPLSSYLTLCNMTMATCRRAVGTWGDAH